MLNQSYEVHIMVLIALGWTHTKHTHRHPHRNNFKKPGAHQPVASTPGLKNGKQQPHFTQLVVHDTPSQRLKVTYVKG